MSDLFVARLVLSVGAFLLASLGLAAVRSLAFVGGSPLGGIPLSAVYFAVALAPFWLVDATLLRPIMLARFGWRLLVPVELVGLAGYRCVIQLPAIRHAAQQDVSGIVFDMIGQVCAFYAIYLAATLFLLRWHRGGASPAS